MLKFTDVDVDVLQPHVLMKFFTFTLCRKQTWCSICHLSQLSGLAYFKINICMRHDGVGYFPKLVEAAVSGKLCAYFAEARH